MTLPSLMPGLNWYVAVDTGNKYLPNSIPETEEEMALVVGGRVRMIPRSVCVFVVK